MYYLNLLCYYVLRVPSNEDKLTTSFKIPGPELPTRLDLQKEVEDHYPGLHPLTTCREHEEEESGGVQHVGLGGWIRPAASHPSEQFPEATPHGSKLQETAHHPRWCQQHIPQQVGSSRFQRALLIIVHLIGNLWRVWCISTPAHQKKITILVNSLRGFKQQMLAVNSSGWSNYDGANGGHGVM